MRATRILLTSFLAFSVGLMACGSHKDSGYSPNSIGNGGGSAASGNGGSSASGNGGSSASGNGGSSASGGSGTGGISNFGGGGPGCDGTKHPNEDACVIHEDYAIFVSPNGEDLNGEGTRSKPYKSFDYAMKEAHLAGKRLYACATAGAYDGAIAVESFNDGLEIYGGFDCTTWNYSAATKTKLTGPATGVVQISSLTKGVTMEDFDITAKDATGAGTPSLGLVASNSQNVVLRRLKITAGQGTAGLNGYSTPGIAKNGEKGYPGQASCNSPPLGGGSSASGCGTNDSMGGPGGSGGTGTNPATYGEDGKPAANGGIGGDGAHYQLGNPVSCTNGQPGKNGAAGPDGNGGKTPGKLVPGGWIPATGGFGGDGQDGGGGGGGGGALAPSQCSIGGPNPATGASGGGGGSGGCGGIGGEGGQGGGASIAFVSYQSTVTLENVDLVASSGGKGGNGGKGQSAGAGQPGGAGGSGACSGGTGGNGGKGGNAGGGAGGPSIGVAYAGTKPVRTGGSIKIASAASQGGADGAGLSTGTGAGTPGVLAQEQSF